PSGETRFPYLGDRNERKKITDAINKFQIIQHSIHEVEYKLVVSEALSLETERKLKQFYQESLGHPFNITLSYHADLPKTHNGKFEEFISLVNPLAKPIKNSQELVIAD